MRNDINSHVNALADISVLAVILLQSSCIGVIGAGCV